MDKTIKYSENLTTKRPKETDKIHTEDILNKIETEYGKDFKGEGFALEQFNNNKQKPLNYHSNK